MTKYSASDGLSWSDLESTLREQLSGVSLVCDADINDALVDAAEAEIRPRLNDPRKVELAPTTRPATLVTYFVIRGSQRYHGNSVWPQLGVVSQTQNAGRAFLASLRRLGLPTFEQQTRSAGARRFVAPMLIHGAFPASAAHRLVDRIEDELGRGLVDAREARERLVASPDLFMAIGRPAARLLEWAPQYSEKLLDSIIDYIEDPSSVTGSALPSHLVAALEKVQQHGRRLGRLAFPRVEFDTWTGYGPELVAPDKGGPWNVWSGVSRDRLQAGQVIELHPERPMNVEVNGHRRTVWEPARAWLFDGNGFLAPTGRIVGGEGIALLPSGVSLRDDQGAEPPLLEQGVPQSGEWSTFRSFRFEVGGADILSAVDSDGAELARWSAEPGSQLCLIGSTVDYVTDAKGTSVFSRFPSLSMSDDVTQVRVELRHGGESPMHRVLETGSSTLDLEDSFGKRPFFGQLSVRTDTGESAEFHVTVVPGLTVEVGDQLLAPGATATVVVDADYLSSPLLIESDESRVELTLDKLGVGPLLVELPRLQWGLRDGLPRRLELADGLIATTVAALVDRPSWLLVRCGRPTELAVELVIDGQPVQHLPARQTRPTGTSYHAAFPLEMLRDTLRAHVDSHVLIVLVSGTMRFAALECGEAATDDSASPRTWSVSAAPESNEAESTSIRQADATIRDVWLHRQMQEFLDDVQAMVWFLHSLGEWSSSWVSSEFPNGTSASEWTGLNRIADRRWNIDGLRFRLFAGDLSTRVRSWSSSWRHRLGRSKADSVLSLVSTSNAVEIDTLALREWRHGDWINQALPPGRRRSGLDQIPALVLLDQLLAITGDEAASSRVAMVMQAEPTIVVEGLAFVMEAIRHVARIAPPPSPLVLPTEPGPALATGELPAAAPSHDGEYPMALDDRPLAALGESVLEVDHRTIRILTTDEARVPALRFCQRGRALAIARAQQVDGFVVVEVPPDIDGEVGLQAVTDALVTSLAQPEITVRLTDRTEPPAPGLRVVHDLRQIAMANLLGEIDVINLATATGRLGLEHVERLFDDELLAGEAMVSFAMESDEREPVDRVAMAVLPSAFLFSRLLEDVNDAGRVLPVSPLLYAVVAPRQAEAWAALGWPRNVHFRANGAARDALAGWARRLAAEHTMPNIHSWRYANNGGVAHEELLGSVVQALEEKHVDESFVDLMIATHRMLNLDSVTPEALRMLLAAHSEAPEATSNAVLAGIGAHLITTNS